MVDMVEFRSHTYGDSDQNQFNYLRFQTKNKFIEDE
jgi:hypothetical protein